MSAPRAAVPGPGGGAAEREPVPVRGRGLELELGSNTQTSHRLLAYSDALLSIIATVMVSDRPGPAQRRRGACPTRPRRGTRGSRVAGWRRLRRAGAAGRPGRAARPTGGLRETAPPPSLPGSRSLSGAGRIAPLPCPGGCAPATFGEPRSPVPPPPPPPPARLLQRCRELWEPCAFERGGPSRGRGAEGRERRCPCAAEEGLCLSELRAVRSYVIQ